MFRVIRDGLGFIVLGLWIVEAAVAQETVAQLASTTSQLSADLSSSSLESHRLFFSVQERRTIVSTEAASESLAADQRSVISGIREQKTPPVEVLSVSAPAVDKAVEALLHFQALLESESTLRLIINGVPCKVAEVSSSQSLDARMSVDCQSAALSGVRLSWIPASRKLEVEDRKGAVSLLIPGSSL